MHADQAHQFVAFVDRQQVILGCGVSTGIAETVDQQAFHIGFHFVQNRVARHNVVPGFEREQGFGRTGGAGIERDYAVFRTAAEKESHVDGDHQIIPLGVAEIEGGKRADAARNAFELHSLAAEQNGAGLASTEKLALRHFDQMRMIGTQAHATQLATLKRALAAGKLAQRVKAAGGLCKFSCTHGCNIPKVSYSRSIRALRRLNERCGDAVHQLV